MNSRFTLNEHCFLVSGAKRGAIYDLQKGDIFSVNEDAHRLLKLCESGVPIHKIFANPVFSQNKAETLFYLNNLKESNLGNFINGKEQIQKINIEKSKHKLDFMWLEVTNRCNLRCIHCYNNKLNYDSSPRVIGNENRMRVIESAFDFGCRKIQFIGGEPFLLENLFELVKFTKNTGYDFIEIFTNGTLIKERQINFLAENEVSIAVSVYGPNPHVHGQVTLSNGSFQRTVNNLKKMKGAGLKIRVGVIAMAINQGYMKETGDFLKKELGIDNVKYDMVRPVGKGDKEELIPLGLNQEHQIKARKFSKCYLDTFSVMRYGHNCFSSKICITTNGEVIPCIMERNIILGNAFRNDLGAILESEKSKKVRGLSKDFIDVCRNCEYRYGCFDCRPKAIKHSSCSCNDFYAKPQDCSYNPYLGEWIN